jgi:dUTP pyrophosphatase
MERKDQNMVTVKIQLLNEDAEMPTPAHEGDAGFDVRAMESVEIAPGGTVLVGTGIAMEIPHGYEAQMRPRSGMAYKRGISLANTPGTIDSGYRGEVKAALHNISVNEMAYVEKGDRIAQIVINKLPEVKLVEVDELSDSERSTGGFGSTGVK